MNGVHNLGGSRIVHGPRGESKGILEREHMFNKLNILRVIHFFCNQIITLKATLIG